MGSGTRLTPIGALIVVMAASIITVACNEGRPSPPSMNRLSPAWLNSSNSATSP